MLRSLLALAVLLILGACGGADPGTGTGPVAGATVVATTTILGDIAANVVCEGVRVDVLMSPGQDPHSFELSPRQATELRGADLVIANGLELEEGLIDVLEEAWDAGVAVLFVGEQVRPIPLGSASDAERGSLDPHVWMDPARMAEAAAVIAMALGDATGEAQGACSSTYIEALEQLDADLARLADAIAPEDRKLATNHASLGYFADRYGFEIVGVVIPGGATLAEPSARDVVELAETVAREGVTVIFGETTVPSDLAKIVAEEAGPNVELVDLYTGSLGKPGSGAETYVEMITTTGERITRALAP